MNYEAIRRQSLPIDDECHAHLLRRDDNQLTRSDAENCRGADGDALFDRFYSTFAELPTLHTDISRL